MCVPIYKKRNNKKRIICFAFVYGLMRLLDIDVFPFSFLFENKMVLKILIKFTSWKADVRKHATKKTNFTGKSTYGNISINLIP